MNRRHIIALAAALAAGPGRAGAAAPSYRVSLIDGGWQDDSRFAGILIELDEGWKTYWRMPGEAGVPPEFGWSRSANAGAITVMLPLPQRFGDASGETVGYKHRVVFPVRVMPADAGQPVKLALDLFFAVCKDICIPGKVSAEAVLAGTDAPQTAHVVSEWLARVPVKAAEPLPVAASTLAIDGGKPALVLALAAPADDIFVEGDGEAYFRKPDFAADGRSARILIDNVKDGAKLVGKSLKLTLARGGAGLEQIITLT